MIIIVPEHISIIQHDIENGITNPKYALTDDNTTVVLKTYNGPEGNLVLFNELFCYRLANLIGVPMPYSGICIVDEKTVDYNNTITQEQYGLGFFSSYLDKSIVLNENIISLINNKEDFYKLILFDHIIFNTDRNKGNLLVQYKKNNIRLKAIDHTHVFINQAIWDSYCLKRGISDRDYLSTKIIEYNQYIYGLFFRALSPSKSHLNVVSDTIGSICSEQSLRAILNDIPIEWRPIKDNEDALIEYILYRINHLEEIKTVILNHWGN